MTPAQASGHPNFVTDVPVQGPTDEGMRAADCWWAQNVLPARPACADCKGPIPMWTQRSLSVVRGPAAGIGEQLSFGGQPVLGFGIGAVEDPEIWTRLAGGQQQWVMETLTKLNDLIVQTTGTSCPTWGPSITAAGGCFQAWWNSSEFPTKLRTDGVFDEDTLCALITIAGIYADDFPTAFPDPDKRYCLVPGTEEARKLSTGAMVGIAAAGAAAIGGIAYMATRGKKTRKKRTRRRRR